MTAVSVQCPAGFLAGGVRAGIKPSGRPDLAAILCPEGATAAAMFTCNSVRAAPLEVSARHLGRSAGDVRALLINAGCANAATGAEGERRAVATVEALAARLGCRAEQVLVNSTGVIGVQLPADKVVAAIDPLVARASPEGLASAAEAIMTTDTRVKMAEAVRGEGAGAFRVAGIAKGAGMIHPALAPAVPHATMIVALLTDAPATPAQLDRLLATACERTVHRISVDGDTSTNDAVFALASGRAGPVDEALLAEAMQDVLRSLALQIVRDGEGARKLVHVRAVGAEDDRQALMAAQTVATSLLVRTAIAGGDPNWGRILAALGRSGARLDPARVRVCADGAELFAHGAPCPMVPEQRERIFAGENVAIDIDLGLGAGRDEFFTCDLTEEYVRINAEYTT